jgi:hypothetical protein
MNSVRDILREADPVAHEGNCDDRLAELRRTILAAQKVRPARAFSPWASSRMTAFAAAAIILVVAMMGSRSWYGGSATLLAAVRFEVRLAEIMPAPGLQQTTVDGRVLYLAQTPVVTNVDISSATVIPRSSTYDIDISFTRRGAAKMRKAMAAHIGQPIAILVDDQVVAAPVVRSAISGTEAVITGKFTKAQAERIAKGVVIH